MARPARPSRSPASPAPGRFDLPPRYRYSPAHGDAARRSGCGYRPRPGGSLRPRGNGGAPGAPRPGAAPRPAGSAGGGLLDGPGAGPAPPAPDRGRTARAARPAGRPLRSLDRAAGDPIRGAAGDDQRVGALGGSAGRGERRLLQLHRLRPDRPRGGRGPELAWLERRRAGGGDRRGRGRAGGAARRGGGARWSRALDAAGGQRHAELPRRRSAALRHGDPLRGTAPADRGGALGGRTLAGVARGGRTLPVLPGRDHGGGRRDPRGPRRARRREPRRRWLDHPLDRR